MGIVIDPERPFWQSDARQLAVTLGKSVAGIYKALRGEPISAGLIEAAMLATGMSFENLFLIKRGAYTPVSRSAVASPSAPTPTPTAEDLPTTWEEAEAQGYPEVVCPIQDAMEEPAKNIGAHYYITKDGDIWFQDPGDPVVQDVLRTKYGIKTIPVYQRRMNEFLARRINEVQL